MKKNQIITMSLALVLAANTCPVFANEDIEKTEPEVKAPIEISFSNIELQDAKTRSDKIMEIYHRGIIKGDQNGSLNISKKITRAEFLSLIANAMNLEDKAEAYKAEPSKFTDVPENFWAKGLINLFSENKLANGESIISGYEDGTFRPNDDITYAEMAKILVLIKNKELTEDDVKNYNSQWPQGWIDVANIMGVFRDVEVKSFKEPVRRSDSFAMLYNTIK